MFCLPNILLMQLKVVCMYDRTAAEVSLLVARQSSLMDTTRNSSVSGSIDFP
jgi:hypothetical protein